MCHGHLQQPLTGRQNWQTSLQQYASAVGSRKSTNITSSRDCSGASLSLTTTQACSARCCHPRKVSNEFHVHVISLLCSLPAVGDLAFSGVIVVAVSSSTCRDIAPGSQDALSLSCGSVCIIGTHEMGYCAVAKFETHQLITACWSLCVLQETQSEVFKSLWRELGSRELPATPMKEAMAYQLCQVR